MADDARRGSAVACGLMRRARGHGSGSVTLTGSARQQGSSATSRESRAAR
eukprot:CAMPEP_0185164758 /NCGR_PEP_ID=MMETSP1139-20130426/9870_1 /TAXON_ID=298111 /ORGANISM="Pavlova sp., Strain CCMP459" /LENGTH=49 /DNA_ID=CAMNT_0027730141 /DNA_START=82 /DNA_END=231 /DNA_ORIENTATION=-